MKRLVVVGVMAAALAVGGAGAALAAPPAGVGGGVPSGIQCQQRGIGTLQSLGLLPAVARGGIEVVAPASLAGVYDFRTVLSLHRSSPELFQTGTPLRLNVLGVSPSLEPTWCDGV